MIEFKEIAGNPVLCAAPRSKRQLVLDGFFRVPPLFIMVGSIVVLAGGAATVKHWVNQPVPAAELTKLQACERNKLLGEIANASVPLRSADVRKAKAECADDAEAQHQADALKAGNGKSS